MPLMQYSVLFRFISQNTLRSPSFVLRHTVPSEGVTLKCSAFHLPHTTSNSDVSWQPATTATNTNIDQFVSAFVITYLADSHVVLLSICYFACFPAFTGRITVTALPDPSGAFLFYPEYRSSEFCCMSYEFGG